MPDLYSIITCGLLAILTWRYSHFLRKIRDKYETRWTWVTVVAGTAMVGTIVLLRLMFLPIPDYTGSWLLLWGWIHSGLHFVAGGLPVIWWQISEDREQLERAYQSRFPQVHTRTNDEGGTE